MTISRDGHPDGVVHIPAGVSGSLVFRYKASDAPTSIVNGFGLVQRNAAGDPTYLELLDTKQRSVGEVFYRTQVQGGEVFEFYLLANKTLVRRPAVTPATYSSDPTKNTAVDARSPQHVALPLQDATQRANNIWVLRWEGFNSADPEYDGDFDDLTIDLQVERPCDNVQMACPDPNVVVSNHNASRVDYRQDGGTGVAGAVLGVNSGPVTDPTGGEGDPTPIGATILVGGRVDTLRWSFVQESVDFSGATPDQALVCPGCGGMAAPALLSGRLQGLEIKRIHRPRAEASVSSFGPGVFSNFDAKLTLRPQGLGNQPTIVFFDPEMDAPPVTFTELSQQDGDGAVDGRYHDTTTRAYASLVLFGVSGSVEPNPSAAKQAVLTRHTGEKLKFEIINTQGTRATELQGRLTALEDRNGNAVTVTYRYAAGSTSAQLGGDRKKLWLINRVTDMHGVGATFNYELRAATSRWAVQSISLPDGTAPQYRYGTDTANLDRLIEVAHANGDRSRFSRAWDAATQSWALTLQDAVGGAVRTWKTLYLTDATYRTADNVIHNQEPNLVRRIVNASGEQVYQAMEDPNDPNTTYVREGSNHLMRMRIDANGLPREVAEATTPAADPMRASYTVLESYTGNVQGMIEQAIDGLGNVRKFARDPNSRDVTSFTARGGTIASFTYNPFRQPTRTSDRLGRITDATYDAQGNLLGITHAVGTTVQGVWQYTYNPRGQVTRATDANNNATDYTYNAAGFLTAIAMPPDVTGGTRAMQRFEYDAVGRLAVSIDASGRRTTYAYDARGRLITTRFADGTTEAFDYGAGATAGLMVSQTNRNGTVEQYEYDAARRLTKVIKAANRPEHIEVSYEYLAGTELPSAETRAGERTEFTYDERLRPTAKKVFINGTASLTSQTTWDALDRPLIDTDPYGRRTLRVYDVNGRVVRTVRELVPDGAPSGADLDTLARITTPNPPYLIEDTAYDAMNQVVAITDARGFRTRQVYDGQGRQVEVVQAAGTAFERKTTFEYDLVGNLTKEWHPRTFSEGHAFETVYTYTGRNLVASQTEAAGTADAATTNYTYTATGKPATATDPRQGVTQYTYDACCDRLASTTDPAGFTTSYGYDGEGNRTSVTNPLGAVTTSTYDGHNRVLTETNALGETTRYEYDDDLTDGIGLDDFYESYIAPLGFGARANGMAVRRTNAANESTVVVRDGAGRTVLEINASGNATRTSYDVVVGGLVETTVTNPLGNATRRREDGAGRPRALLDADGQITTRSFDAAGNLVSERDPNGVGKDCQYDELGQRTACTDTQGDTTRWEYDAAGNQVARTDGAGVRTTCTFDARNRRKSCTDGVGATTRWTYDDNSNITAITDGEEHITRYTFDARNLRTSATFPDSTGPADQMTYSYDGTGRLASITDQAGNTRAFTYDAADQLKQKTDPDGFVDSYDYDSVGRLRTAISGRYGTTVTRDYDNGGRLSDETLSVLTLESTYAVSYTYDAADRTTKIRYPDGSEVNRTYTNRDQLASIALGTRSVAQYAYDAGGRVNATTLGNGLVETRTYRNDDTLSRISTTDVGDFTYSYDGQKRKLTESGTAVNGPQSFSYDNEGRLTNWNAGSTTQSWSLSPVGDWQSTTRNAVVETHTHDAAHELTAIDGSSLSYDPRGNLVQDDQENTLAWDFENRLTDYQPDEGQNVSYLYDALGRRVGRSTGETTTVFVHAGEEVIAEYEDGDVRAKYILGAQIDGPVAYVLGGNVYWYTSNHVGTVGAVTDESGAVVERYRYDAYGARTVLSPTGAVRALSAVGNQIGFTGRYHDQDTGLIDFRFRQYDPRLGRFVSRDDDYHDGMSLYGAHFVPNNTDPTGHYTGGIVQSRATFGSTDLNSYFSNGGFCWMGEGAEAGPTIFPPDPQLGETCDSDPFSMLDNGFFLGWISPGGGRGFGGGGGGSSGSSSGANGPLPATDQTLQQYTKGTLAQGRAVIDPKLKETGDLGKTDHLGHVRISPDAFASKGLLISTIEHESAHVKQIKEGRFHAFDGTPADFVNEVEAYRDGLKRSESFSNDMVLDPYRPQWRTKINDLIEKLVGTPYYDRVRRTPPDYTLETLDKCPPSECHL